jgi:ABC-type branched-subunit amino acid transport system ATPase component
MADRGEIGAPLLEVENVFLSFGGVVALHGVSFDVREREIRAIIGPNGAGKSSMLTSSTASTARSAVPSRSRGASAAESILTRPRPKASPGPSRISRSSGE